MTKTGELKPVATWVNEKLALDLPPAVPLPAHPAAMTAATATGRASDREKRVARPPYPAPSSYNEPLSDTANSSPCPSVPNDERRGTLPESTGDDVVALVTLSVPPVQKSP